MITQNTHIRNIAIIAHVDHGKTTLVDALFRQSGLFGNSSTERIMDSGAIERERGITISAKNCAIIWKGVKVNIIDTPGHADFGGEVERGLSMVDGVIVLVDAAEGPLPQTRFVLEKALAAGLSVIVVINKVDRADARPAEVLDEVYDLLLELDPRDDMLDVPVFYASGRSGRCGRTPDQLQPNLHLLLDGILEHVPAPRHDTDEPFQMLVSDLGYSDFLGRLAIGKVMNGSASTNDSLVCIEENTVQRSLRVTKLHTYEGNTFHEVPTVESGDIIVLAGVGDVSIGDTICTQDNPKALPRLTVDEPTVSMLFSKNISPLAGKEGKIVTSARIGDRLMKETLRNVSIRVEKNSDDTYTVKGRGEFQMAIIVEQMRREGFELCIGRPKIIFHVDSEGGKTEPIENLLVDCPEEFSGTIMDKLSRRKGMMKDITYTDTRVKMNFEVPARGLIGFRDEFLTITKGQGIMNSSLKGYFPYRGEIIDRTTGSLISDRAGNAIPYALWQLEDRGKLFIIPGDPVYEGEVIGEHNKEGDLLINPTRTKKLSNMRASGKDEAVTLVPVVKQTLEQAMQFIKEDELVEVTPLSIRMCKRILDTQQRRVFENRGVIPDFMLK
ncbi:translational GTPase TypA [Parasphaerochaeta coccoides]|uniref:Large ribosomal subunit assembly factor BipA n=1 Tax=Parasphaerochaeta coccoides (strain ATCC BAA-1237 / DSM 17374 / SPN1) TaxID=760011 RepID=F4GLK4_PARC1|nr:translational GTPase TypA [Parasphaerochaeta coccoides]AEC01974.1 GTP-binding protein TypA [Parasphaerochaeta coccoides DSM 17374]